KSAPTVCFVDKKAISAGALIALSGEKLVMRPGTTLGAAEPRAGSEKADEKTVSMWTSQLSAVAEARGRNGLIAAAMSDSDIAIEGVIEKGKLLTLGDKQALNLGMIDAVLDTREEIIRDFHLPSTVVEIDPSFKQQAVQWLSSPYIASILLTIGIAGIVIEIFTAGFGVFGAVGMISFLAFFIGNFWAGNAGLGAILLFLLGAFLIIMEIFVIPGFGVPGVLGIASILFSIIFASPDIQYAAISIVIALAGSIVLIAISLKNRRTRKLWSKIILSQKQENKEGYSSQNLVQENLLGCYGLAVTPLRPAGTAIFDNKRIDVVTEGEFLDKDTPIEVIEVSGGRVVVKRKS
ncbi:MAG: NfeD family protein, partial [Clostridiales bacterium]